MSYNIVGIIGLLGLWICNYGYAAALIGAPQMPAWTDRVVDVLIASGYALLMVVMIREL